MATLARNHHNKIQKDGRETAPDIWDHMIDVVLERTARRVSASQKQTLSRRLTRNDVKQALKLSANNKAPGLNVSHTSSGKPLTQGTRPQSYWKNPVSTFWEHSSWCTMILKFTG
jgi:hypothetical protein